MRERGVGGAQTGCQRAGLEVVGHGRVVDVSEWFKVEDNDGVAHGRWRRSAAAAALL